MKRACIVIPTLNESENVTNVLPKVFEMQANISSYELNVLIVDGDSKDGTQQTIKKLQKTYAKLHMIVCKKRGLGEAYKAGFSHAIETLNPELIFEMDADGQHDPKMIPIFIELIQHDFDCIIGSRFASGGQLINFSLRRKLISTFGNYLIRVIGGIPNILDCTSGYRCIKADFIKRCTFKNLLTSGYAFQSSLVAELVRNDARIMEFPIIFNERNFGESKLRLIDQIDFLINLFFIRLNRSFEFIKYAIIGGTGIIVNMGSYYLLTRVTYLSYHWAVLIAIELSIISNFIGHNFWTFNSKNQVRKPLLLRISNYHLSVIASTIIQLTTFFMLVYVIGIKDLVAQFLGICCGFVANYFFNTKITWKKTKRTKKVKAS